MIYIRYSKGGEENENIRTEVYRTLTNSSRYIFVDAEQVYIDDSYSFCNYRRTLTASRGESAQNKIPYTINKKILGEKQCFMKLTFQKTGSYKFLSP